MLATGERLLAEDADAPVLAAALPEEEPPNNSLRADVKFDMVKRKLNVLDK